METDNVQVQVEVQAPIDDVENLNNQNSDVAAATPVEARRGSRAGPQ